MQSDILFHNKLQKFENLKLHYFMYVSLFIGDNNFIIILPKGNNKKCSCFHAL